MRHRVAVEADYDYRQPGTLYIPERPAFFFCEIPEAWVSESDELTERLFAVGITDLRDLCAGVNAWQQANRPQAPDVDIRLKAVRGTVLTPAETEAAPWLILPHPLRYPCRCLIVESEERFAASERDDFQRRAHEDISRLRLLLPPAPRLPTDELVPRDICGLTFLFYGDRLVTQRNENQPGTDYCGFDTFIYRFSLYRRPEQELVLKKEHGIWNDYASENHLDAEYIVSRDNGGTWDPGPDFDGTALNGLEPVWSYN